MSRVLVSIISKHTLPNLLLIKEMKGNFDELAFITTPEVERMNTDVYMTKALKVNEADIATLKVDGNDYHKTMEDLNRDWEVRQGDKYIVNITGGTKIMSLAVHDFFSQFDSEFYYVPISQNKYNNIVTGEWTPITYRASLKEYLTLYGLSFSSEDHLMRDASYTYNLFQRVKNKKFKLTWEMYNAQEQESPEDKRYYGGTWFEEYTYLRLKKQYNLDDSMIARGVKISHSPNSVYNDNELDVAFMFNNELYVVECKVTMFGYGSDARETIDKYLYKLAAISKDFGLNVNTFLFTLHDMNKFPEQARDNISKRCRILGIKGIISSKELTEATLSLKK